MCQYFTNIYICIIYFWVQKKPFSPLSIIINHFSLISSHLKTAGSSSGSGEPAADTGREWVKNYNVSCANPTSHSWTWRIMTAWGWSGGLSTLVYVADREERGETDVPWFYSSLCKSHLHLQPQSWAIKQWNHLKTSFNLRLHSTATRGRSWFPLDLVLLVLFSDATCCLVFFTSL